MVTGSKQTVLETEVVEEFRTIQCADIADALLSLGLVGIAQGLPPFDPQWKICGRAVTMRQLPLQDPAEWSGPDTNLANVLEICNPGDVVVVDAGGRLDVGIFGSIAALAAKKSGLGGYVIDAAVRDAHELVEIGCPIFARGVCLRYPSYLFTASTNTEPIQIGAPPMVVTVKPGDLVAADVDGLVVVPAARAVDVLAVVRQGH